MDYSLIQTHLDQYKRFLNDLEAFTRNATHGDPVTGLQGIIMEIMKFRQHMHGEELKFLQALQASLDAALSERKAAK